MWLMTPTFFCSVVMKTGSDYLTVRCRVANDLKNLRQRYMPTLSETFSYTGSDYPFRATISHEDFAEGMKKVVLGIGYDNFKNEVAKTQGHERAGIYGRVWYDLLRLEEIVEEK